MTTSAAVDSTRRWHGDGVVYLRVKIPMRLDSIANVRPGHWGVAAKAVKAKRGTTRLYLHAASLDRPKTPCLITLCRIAPRPIVDEDDNLRAALKNVKDGVADYLGFKNDSHKDLTWRYAQERGMPHEEAVRITIESLETEAR